MKCNFKLMLSVGLVMALGAAFAYLAFEDARVAIVASLPVLAALLCPISMLVMMKFMHSSGQAQACANQSEEAVAPRRDDKRLGQELA
jgi:hypothetical protein